MDAFIYAVNFALLLSFLLDLRCSHAEQRFSFGLIRISFFLPLLAIEYMYLSANMQPDLIAPFSFSENLFAVYWIVLSGYLNYVIDPPSEKSKFYRIAPILTVIIGFFIGSLWMFGKPLFKVSAGGLIFLHYGHLYFSALFVLIAILINAWRLEAFWRALDPKSRKQYKYLIIGFFLIDGSMGWASSLRLTYLHVQAEHLLLLSCLLIIAWLFVGYAIAGNRLLNRKIFVSRKIVYSTVAPFIFAVYLIGTGIASLLMRTFDWSLPFVLQWLIIVSGLLLIVIFALSESMRTKVKYFISTHFYVNKYEYRDEWLAFSDLLHRELTENGVVEALRHILHDSMYTDTIKIWVEDAKKGGFHLIDAQIKNDEIPADRIAQNDPIIKHLKSNAYLDCRESTYNSEQEPLLVEKKLFFKSLGLVLLVPLAIGEHFVGVMGLGPEYTGGTYGKDDYDLLTAIGSQAASALLAVRTAEELARAREQAAFQTLSAFVLHDIKNAATMLSLITENAPKHIQNPEFQQDLLASVQDALRRMIKVQTRLKTLKGEIEPVIKPIIACDLIKNLCLNADKKLAGLKTDLECRNLKMRTDPDFIAVILENLLINAWEANSGSQVLVKIRLELLDDQYVQMEIRDNGPGISSEMLPDRLFDPFITAKPKGSGIGLWQARRLIEALGGNITAQNAENGGARFLLIFPRGL